MSSSNFKIISRLLVLMNFYSTYERVLISRTVNNPSFFTSPSFLPAVKCGNLRIYVCPLYPFDAVYVTSFGRNTDRQNADFFLAYIRLFFDLRLRSVNTAWLYWPVNSFSNIFVNKMRCLSDPSSSSYLLTH